MDSQNSAFVKRWILKDETEDKKVWDDKMKSFLEFLVVNHILNSFCFNKNMDDVSLSFSVRVGDFVKVEKYIKNAELKIQETKPMRLINDNGQTI